MALSAESDVSHQWRDVVNDASWALRHSQRTLQRHCDDDDDDDDDDRVTINMTPTGDVRFAEIEINADVTDTCKS